MNDSKGAVIIEQIKKVLAYTYGNSLSHVEGSDYITKTERHRVRISAMAETEELPYYKASRMQHIQKLRDSLLAYNLRGTIKAGCQSDGYGAETKNYITLKIFIYYLP